MSGVIANGAIPAGIIKTGGGKLRLTAVNTYTGSTTISGGALQANDNVGLPSASLLRLDGGVLQSNGGGVFTRSLGTSGKKFQWTANGGGFSADTSPMTVNIGGNSTPSTLDWGTSIGSQIVGTLALSSLTAESVTTFQNPINLNGENRTIRIECKYDSRFSYYEYAYNDRGAISDGSGSAGINKTGSGLLVLTGNNTFSGITTINDGKLQIGDGGTTGVLPGNVSNNAILAFDRSDNITFGGVVFGTGNLVQQGIGMLTLTSANSYSGETSIKSGTLALAGDGQIDPLSLIFNEAKFLIADGTHTVGSISGTGFTLVSGSAQLSATSIQQDALIIGAPSMTIAVPEPDMLALLISLVALGATGYFRKKR
jgi:autotransporter-associated beta strand protein